MAAMFRAIMNPDSIAPAAENAPPPPAAAITQYAPIPIQMAIHVFLMRCPNEVPLRVSRSPVRRNRHEAGM